VNSERLTGPALLLGFCLLAQACSGGSSKPAQTPLSTRARESALAKTGLPGATGIGSALRVSDSADARRKLEDSLAKAVP
jgi:hypothetical protein